MTLFNNVEEYDNFVNKFKPKKTTDDCYTPPLVYEAVLKWAVNEYGLHGREVVRPFYPDGDFEEYPYPDACVVVDNPPFSILAKILEFYNARNIDYFLFAPALTIFSTAGLRANSIITDSLITYENGAVVQTSFVTNLGKWKIHVSPQLHDAVADAMEQILEQKRKVLPKYIYPDNVLVAAVIQKLATRGQELKIPPEHAYFIRGLDSQRSKNKAIFGAGFLLSEKAAAEKAAAEKWSLSDRELAIISSLGIHK